ncbi:unnamed protein product [Vitrella brassicaformis CCMP3155]|uniref:Exostosin GT47 domain-containing protein n=1 Tax=Vitrella brassicaformis (strain CCMP3155) TaxID=1169540 RepID=A0A0G4FEE2_VITBC|nr:unnamed protein product [Vitrella brassicaformis CCMP3155]|eukprot:CEM11577.1 unnamed protein product [Vitrella brassicaformis CCMP3155]
MDVPFYVYETPSLMEMYNRCQVPARAILEGTWPANVKSMIKKKIGEIFWLDQLWNDTWRTFDPDQALVYVLPIYPVLLLDQVCKGLKRNQTHELATRAVHEITAMPYYYRHGGLDHIVIATDWRMRGSMKKVFGSTFHSFVGNITWGRTLTLDKNRPWQCGVNVPHTSAMTYMQKAYEPFEKESLLERGFIAPEDVFEDDRLDTALDPPSRRDWFARDYNLFFQGQADTRHAYRYRRLGLQHLAGWRFRPNTSSNVLVSSSKPMTYQVLDADGKERREPIPSCPRKDGINKEVFSGKMGKFERCNGRMAPKKEKGAGRQSDKRTDRGRYAAATFLHRLGNSKLNLCFRGDDVTSNRLFDGLWTRTLNVLVTEIEKTFTTWLPFQCEIPWRNFTYAIDGPEFVRSPRESLTPILQEVYDDPAAVRERLRLQDYYSRKALWNAPGSTTARSTLRAMTRQCLTDEIKIDFIQRTAGSGMVGDVRGHPLFAPCVFPDTLVGLDAQRAYDT